MATSLKGRIQSRPNPRKNLGSDITGLRRTGLDTDRDGFLYVPTSFTPKKAAPLLVMLHAAGGDSHDGVEPFRAFADKTGTIIIAPETQGTTWDLLSGGFGEDLFLIDEALSDAFALYNIDPKKIAIGGFSEGATYAMAVASMNSDLFTHIIALSPGTLPGLFSAIDIARSPRIFMAHGKNDEINPSEGTLKLARELKDKKIDVTIREFDGGHEVSPEIAAAAFVWLSGTDVGATKAAGISKIRPEIDLD